MAGYGRADDGGAEREFRFVHLLQPNRDMATNWSVDVGKQLESYLEELKATGLFDDADCSLNFAEAALLIQGSTQVYSRKVEYLYSLVLRALDFLAQKKQGGQEGETSAAQQDDQDCNPADEEEENFLRLDDLIQEEEDIDFLDEEGLGPKATAMKIPPCLRVTEADSNDLSGDAAELASYNVAMCTMYRNFLLLDPGDSESVDKYFEDDENCRREGREACGGEESSPPGRPVQKIPVPQGAGSPAAELNPTKTPGGMDVPYADWEGDGDDGMMWDDPHADEEIKEVPGHPAPTEGAGGGEEVVPVEDDPWEPLNPHEPGTLPVKPFLKGKTLRKAKPKKDRSAPVSFARRTGVCFPEFAKALQIKERQERVMRRGKEPTQYENLRNSFFPSSEAEPAAHTDGLGGSSVDSDNEDNDWAGEFDASDDRDVTGSVADAPLVDPTLPSQAAYSGGNENDIFGSQDDSPEFEQGVDDENMSLEDLCRAHVESVMQKVAESQVRSGLAARVTSWKNKIEGTLREDESRPPFDIHEYGDILLEKLSSTAATNKTTKGVEIHESSFTNLVTGQAKDQVSRSFSALLQLVNNGNVMIERGNIVSKSYCFTASSPFSVRLLNSQNCHEGMFQHMAPPPANAGKGSSRSRQQQTPPNQAGPSQRVRTPVMVSERRLLSPASSSRTLRSGLRVGNNLATPSNKSGPSQRVRTPIKVFERILSPVMSLRTGLRVGSSTAVFISPASVRKSSRKRGQSGNSTPLDLENLGISSGKPDNGFTPVKLTPNRRQSKRKPFQVIQI